METLGSLSASIAALAARSSPKLFHVPSPMGGRTALGFDGRRLLTPALEAEKGEKLRVLAPGGKEVEAEVEGFDPRLGLAVLALAEARPETAWEPATTPPALGSLLLVAAYPSPEGPEVRLDTLRCLGGEGEDAYLQTDGSHFPGFDGAALVEPEGGLAGFLLADEAGNAGWALPAARARSLVDSIASGASGGRAWLGISTVPIEAPAELGQDWKGALLVSGLEAEGPAAKAGLRVGDVLAAVGGRELHEPYDLLDALASAKPGEKLVLAVFRSGARLELEAVPGARQAGPRGGGGHWRGHGHGRWGRPGWGRMMGGGCDCAPGR
jgi:S1-C subfamily serine protease